jgi:hypothetical protein
VTPTATGTVAPSVTPSATAVTLGLTLESGGFEAPGASEAAVVEEGAP